MVSVRVGDGRLGGLAGRRVRTRSPVDRGSGSEVGVGRCRAVHDGISTSVVIVNRYCSARSELRG